MYLYAITDRPEGAVPDIPGLENISPLSLGYRGIAAVVGPLTTAQALPSEANLWLHEAVVEALMADHTVLPMRFGAVLADEAAVQAVLAAHYADFTANLQRMRGRVELGLRVLWDDEPSPLADGQRQTADDAQLLSTAVRRSSSGCGRSYLLARLEEERRGAAWRQRAEALAMELCRPLADQAAESTRRVLITPRLLLTAAFLVDQNRVMDFRQAVGALSTAYPALRFLCTGPWPPYSFVTAIGPAVNAGASKYVSP